MSKKNTKKKQAGNEKLITTGGRFGSNKPTIILTAPRRGGLGVEDYLSAIKSAEIIDHPRRVKLLDMYQDVKTDSHVFSVLRKQKAAILSTPIVFMRDGKVDEKMQEHIDSPWFSNFIEDIIDNEWEGAGGSLFQFFREPNGWINYQLIPRKHVDPINKLILREQSATSGESWEDFDNLLHIGNPRRIGNMAVLAFWVILKRNNVGDWAELGELFGRPLRTGEYDAFDDEAREKLIEDLFNMGGAGIFIHPTGTNIDFKEAANLSGGSDLYHHLHNVCNNEISKAVNGNTLTTEAGDKGTQALGTVQKEGEVDLAFFIKRNIMNILNYDVTDIFAKMGINTAGGKFVFNPPKQKDDTKRVGVLRTLKNDLGLPISHEYLYEEFGVPKPDNYEELVEEMKAKHAAISGKQTEDEEEEEEGEEKNGKNQKKKQEDKKKKEDRFFNRLANFFGRAPRTKGADLDW